MRPLCHLAVALWIGAALAWSALRPESAPASAPEPRATARVQPVAEPPPESEPPPAEPAERTAEPEPPRPAPEPPAPPARPAAVQPADVAAGRALLDGRGEFPALSCSYAAFPSFVAYARAMTRLGARFVVVRNRQILGAVDLESGRVVASPAGRGFSPRARDYTDEPALAALALAARGRFGRGAEVMMLVPRELDAGLFGGIARALARRGDRHGAYRELRGRYERAPDGGVQLRIDDGVRLDGQTIAFDWLFDLGQIARTGRA